MLFADLLLYLFLICSSVLIFNCCWLATVALFPRMVARAETSYSRPWRLVGLGMLSSAVFVLLGALMIATRNPVGRYGGLAIIAIPVLLGLIGSTCLTQRIGAGLPSPVDESQPWRRVLRGGFVLSVIFLLPFIGWMLIFPFTLFSGVGALVDHWWTSRREKSPASSPAVESSGAVAAENRT